MLMRDSTLTTVNLKWSTTLRLSLKTECINSSTVRLKRLNWETHWLRLLQLLIFISGVKCLKICMTPYRSSLRLGNLTEQTWLGTLTCTLVLIIYWHWSVNTAIAWPSSILQAKNLKRQRDRELQANHQSLMVPLQLGTPAPLTFMIRQQRVLP